MGVRFREGEGVPFDLSEAARWLKLAAEAGEAYAQNEWGVALRFGSGIPKDIVKAAYWFIESAKQQDFVALGNLSDMSEEVELVANTGNEQAQQYLAIIKNLKAGLASDKPKKPGWISSVVSGGSAGAGVYEKEAS